MKAIFREKFGKPQDVLVIKEVETPTIKENQILVKVKAASISPADAGFVTGKKLEFRLAYMGMGIKGILGAEIAGEVAGVGSSVTDFKVGDNIFADISNAGFGGFAEYVAVDSEIVSLMPENISFTEAASLPQAAVVALQAIRQGGGVKPGMNVLVNGAAGGIGCYVTQIALAGGATVTAVGSQKQSEFLKGLGASVVLDYSNIDFAKQNVKYDLIIDTFANRGVGQIKKVLTKDGNYIMIGGQFSKLIAFGLFGGKRLKTFMAKISKEDLNEISKMIEKGNIKPVVDKVFEFKDAAKAIQHYVDGKTAGKVVVRIQE